MPRLVRPCFLYKCATLALDGPSSEIGSTTNLSRGMAACRRSRLGISFTQGAHQVAHRLISRALPVRLARRSGLSSASRNSRSGMGFGGRAGLKRAMAPVTRLFGISAHAVAGRAMTAAAPVRTTRRPGRKSRSGYVISRVPKGSMAHSDMLVAQRILTAKDGRAIKRGLIKVREEIESARFKFSTKLEDIHFNVEARLTALIGPAGGRLHTARSRNDQIALDVRLWVRDTIDRLEPMLRDLQAALIDSADEYAS